MRRKIVAILTDTSDSSLLSRKLNRECADVETEDQTNYLIHVPNEILFEILKYCEPTTDIPAVSRVSSTLYSACNSANYWRDKFIEKGLSLDLFRQISGRMIDYPVFYRVYLRVSDKRPGTLEDLIVAIIDDYLQSCINKDESAKKPFQDARCNDMYFNRGLNIINNIYRREVANEAITDHEKQLVDVIAMLMDIDSMKKVYAYTRIFNKYVNTNGYH